MKPALMFVMILILPLCARAVEWESIARQGNQEILVDLDSYNEPGAYSSITARVIAHQSNSSMVTQQMQWEFDCAQQRYRQHQPAAKQAFKPLGQDAPAKTVYGLVCQVRSMLNPQS